jgi:hypothetical protein
MRRSRIAKMNITRRDRTPRAVRPAQDKATLLVQGFEDAVFDAITHVNRDRLSDAMRPFEPDLPDIGESATAIP